MVINVIIVRLIYVCIFMSNKHKDGWKIYIFLLQYSIYNIVMIFMLRKKSKKYNNNEISKITYDNKKI